MSRDEVRAFDAWAIKELGIPAVVLMENAGRSCAELIKQKLGPSGRAKVCIFCGTGNNGGDGYVIARHLNNSGIGVLVVLCGEREKVKGNALVNLEILGRQAVSVEQLDVRRDDTPERVRHLGFDADIIVDAVFGTGLRGRLRTEYARLIDCINALGLPIVAVDIPSGLDCDSGEALGTAIRAASTVTFVAVKKGFALSGRADEYTGEIFVASIGVEPGV